MKGIQATKKLSVEQINEVLMLVARGYGSMRIMQHLQDKYGITMNRVGIWKNYINNKKYQERITAIRNKIDEEVARHPLASKANRLEILLEAIEEAMTWRNSDIKYDKDGKEIHRIEKRQISVISRLVEQARKEIEGDDDKGVDLKISIVNVIKQANKNGKLEGSGELRDNRTGTSRLDKFMAKGS